MKWISSASLLSLFICMAMAGCERIPDFERRSAQGKSVESSRKLSELRKWLWTCRGDLSQAANLGGRREVGEQIEEFIDYFRVKGLSSIDQAESLTILGNAVLWRESGVLVTSISTVAGSKLIECSNGLLPWTPVSVKGFDRGLDLAVLQISNEGLAGLKNYQHWVSRTESPSLDERLYIVGSIYPGRLDRLQVELQPFSTSMHTGLDEQLLFFLPSVPRALEGGILVDQQWRVAGYLLPYQSKLWGVALSTERIDAAVVSVLKKGHVSYPQMGLRLRLKEGQGFIVQQVLVGGPAYRAGLRSQDLLLKFDSKDLKALSDWQEVGAQDIGRRIPIVYERGNHSFESEILVEAAE